VIPVEGHVDLYANVGYVIADKSKWMYKIENAAVAKRLYIKGFDYLDMEGL
jgi:riboflavin synthase alpha subunit